MDINTITKVAAIGLGAYVFGQILLFKPSIDAWDYWEARGYVNGLIRGAGSRDAALTQLTAWRDYWKAQRSWAGGIIDHFYNYGLQGIEYLYGTTGMGVSRVELAIDGSLVD